MKQVLLVFMSLLWTYVLVAQPAIGLINDFEDGSLSGWRKGNAVNNPEIIETGGPNGADDAFLRLISDGSQSGGKWIIFNTTSAWTGDWMEAGITALRMSVRNNSNMAVTMRLALGTANAQMNNGAIFSSGVEVAANSEWVDLEIPVTPDDFSGGNANNTLSNVGVLRILHNNNPSWNGANVVASIDIDNITTVGETIVEDLVISCTVTQDVTENGGADGSANVNIAGGTPPYTITVNGVAQDGMAGDNSLDNLSAGSYEINVSDADTMSASCMFEITEPQLDPVVISCTVIQNVSEMGGSDGSANINITGGTAPYSISVNGVSQDGETGDNILDNLVAGSYEIIVSSSNTLSDTCMFEITEPTVIPLSINCMVLEQVSEAGGMDGSASVSISGGTAPYTIEIVAGDFSETFSGSDSTVIFDSLAAGSYTVSVLDSSEMFTTCGFTITEPLPPFNFQNFQASLTGKNQLALVQTLGFGEFSAALSNDTLTISGSVDNLSSPVALNIGGGAHVHMGLQGQNGGVVFPLAVTLHEDSLGGTFAADSNQFIVDSSILSALNNRGLYINIHTQNHPSGEIRGQLVPMNSGLFSANMLGTNTVPSTMTLAQGSAILDIVDDQLTVSGAFQNLEGDFTNAHIHIGMAGTNGGVVFPLSASISENARGGIFEAIENTFTITSAQLDDIQNRRYYINIHSSRAPSGEIRGQVVSGRARGVFRAALAGSNEIPRAMTEATGMVLAEVMNDSVVHLSGSFRNLEGDLAVDIAGGSHLHNGMPGTNREVLVPLNVTTVDGTNYVYAYNDNQFTLTDTDIPRIYNRGVYVNIHSTRFQGGEIRGQLLPESHIVFDAYLSSIFSNPNVNSNAIGKVKATLRGNVLQLNGSFAGLSGQFASQVGGGAHIHMGLAGSTGGIVFPLVTTVEADSISGRFRPQDNRFELDSTQMVILRNRGLYVNIHSEHSLPGEIRGQLLHEANLYFAAPLSGASAIVPVKSAGSGMVVFEVAGNRLVASGSVNNIASGINTAIAGGAHIHIGMAGRNGSILLPLSVTQPVDSTNAIFRPGQNNWTVSNGLIDTMRSRAYYVNIHSNAVGSGEVRGQILPFANSYYTAFLSGINQPIPVSSTGNGHLKIELNGGILTSTGTFNNLSTPLNVDVAGGAHIHQGGPGMGGGVVIPLSATVTEDSLSGRFVAGANSVALDSSQWALLRSGRLYVNIHSQQSAGGELRGQILREVNDFPSASTITSPENSMVVEIDPNTDLPFTVSWSSSDDRDSVVYLWQLAIDTGFALVVFTVPAGTQTQLLFDNDSLSTTLSSLGIDMGDSVTVYHRVISMDGSLHCIGDIASATLVNGVMTSTIVLTDRNIKLDLFPNPAQEALNIRLSESLDQETDLYILNMQGQTLFSDRLSRGAMETRIDIRDLPSNMYLLKIGDQAITWLKG